MTVESPVRPFRRPRYSVLGDSPNENQPTGNVSTDMEGMVFPRQLQPSPTKFHDRNVMKLIGGKVPSSVPGRRSSIGCVGERRTMAPVVFTEYDLPEDCLQEGPSNASSKFRSKSVKEIARSNRSGSRLLTLRRL
jgi:hypothetical protein